MFSITERGTLKAPYTSHLDLENNKPNSVKISVPRHDSHVVWLKQASPAGLDALQDISVDLDDGATLHCVIEQHLLNDAVLDQAITVSLGRNSTITLGVITTGGKSVVSRMTAAFNQAHAHGDFYALSYLKKNSAVRYDFSAQHLIGNSTSNQTFKSIVADNATSHHKTYVHVAKHAQETHTQQISSHVNLSKRAKAYSRPELDILADNVKCNHGATIGQLSQTALFYLMTRGLTKKQAKQYLLDAFMNDSMRVLAPTPALEACFSGF